MAKLATEVRQNGSVINKSVFLALGINTEARKRCRVENEGAKFWLNVLTELKNRGLQDTLIACVDGLKGFPSNLKAVYHAPTREAALMALEVFAEVWEDKYPQISKSWRVHWENLNTFFGYPPDIRKAIYTTNTIESLNSVIRAAIKKCKVLPTGDSVQRVIYLAIKDASKKWSMPLQYWRLAMSRFIMDRL
ncbi:transposase IS1113 [Salmonella enterica]|nr:transposase IS1113 [Salmonella enterica]